MRLMFVLANFRGLSLENVEVGHGREISMRGAELDSIAENEADDDYQTRVSFGGDKNESNAQGKRNSQKLNRTQLRKINNPSVPRSSSRNSSEDRSN